MSLTYLARHVSVGLIAIGVLAVVLRFLQTPLNVSVYAVVTPALSFERELRVGISQGPRHLVEAFEKAVREWDKAVAEFNGARILECQLTVLLGGCRRCVEDLLLPRIRVTHEGDYNVLVEFSEDIPSEGAVAYTTFLEGSTLARIVVWSGVPEHRAYQVAVHEVSRLYGLDTPALHRTLFGAIPASIDTRLLHRSMDDFMHGGGDPLKPTTIELYAAYHALNRNSQFNDVKTSIAFRAYDEPDFTIPALLSPFMITAGVYILSRRGKNAG